MNVSALAGICTSTQVRYSLQFELFLCHMLLHVKMCHVTEDWFLHVCVRPSLTCLLKTYKDLCTVPAGSVDGFLIRGRNGEAHRWHHGLISCRTDNLPLSPLRVILQYTFLSFADRDLRKRDRDRKRGTEKKKNGRNKMGKGERIWKTEQKSRTDGQC